jgi:hypothetical protein
MFTIVVARRLFGSRFRDGRSHPGSCGTPHGRVIEGVERALVGEGAVARAMTMEVGCGILSEGLLQP